MSVEVFVEGKGTLKDRLNNIMVSYLLPLLARPEKSEIERLIAEAAGLATSKPDESWQPESSFHSTVTDFARLRGLSTSQPRSTAM